ncbi:MAG: DUF4199 domain-containing protein [Bacteroidia bacterium]|nr:DUF4199 domain-containing protein [Bacteroidia bacterium]
MMETKSPWPIALKYGLILALALIVLHLFKFLIFGEDLKEIGATEFVFMFLNYGIIIFLLTTAGKMRRDADFGGFISYGGAYKFSLLVSFITAVIFCLYMIIYFQLINPEYLIKLGDMQAEQLAKSGNSEKEIERTMGIMKIFSGVTFTTIIIGLTQMLTGVILGLISSIFVRKEQQLSE